MAQFGKAARRTLDPGTTETLSKQMELADLALGRDLEQGFRS
jgi:hypothetical protein